MKKFLALLFFAGVLFPNVVRAGDFRNGRTVVIDKTFYGDLYIAGGEITINAPIYGDLTVAGGTVTINDSIMNDVIVAGGTVIINGYVGDDVRCAGGRVSIGGFVKGDLIVAAGEMKVTSAASAESIIITGGDVVLDGKSRTNLKVASGNFHFNGEVAQDADMRGGDIYINGKIGGKATLGASDEIIFTPDARVERSIRYWLPFGKRLNVPEGVSQQAAVYDPLLSITYSRWYFLGASSLLGLLWYLGMAYVLILTLLYLFPSVFNRAGDKVLSAPFRSGLWGFAYLVGIPVAAALLLVTIICVPLALLAATLYVITLLMATIISAVVITNWVENVSSRTWTFWHKSGIALFAFVLLKIITFTPFFGSLLMLIICAVAFGSVLTSIKWKRANLVNEKRPRVLAS